MRKSFSDRIKELYLQCVVKVITNHQKITIMNKILRLSLVCLVTLFFGTAFAQTTFNFNEDYATLFPSLPGTSSNESNDGDFNELTTCTVNGVSVTVSPLTSGQNANRIWTSTPRLRMYSGTLTITAPEGSNLTRIDFDCGKWNEANAVTTGELTVEDPSATWTGSANSVELTIAGNTQFNSLTVYLNGEEPVDISNTPETAYTVAEAIELANSGADLGTNVYIKGIITEIEEISTSYGNATYFINDTESTEGQLEVFRGYYFDGDRFTSEDAIKVGDEVIIYGQLSFYYENLQVAQGSEIYSLNGATEPTPGVDISNTPETAYTVAEANELIAAGEGLETEVYVKGIITQIDEVSTDFGNATYYINDSETTEGQLMIFRGYYLNGDRFTSGDEIKLGDKVVVYGQLVNYNGTYEMTTGSQIYSLNDITSGINNATAEELDSNAPVYNLAGQRVSKDTKGILIQNGKKFLNK